MGTGTGTRARGYRVRWQRTFALRVLDLRASRSGSAAWFGCGSRRWAGAETSVVRVEGGKLGLAAAVGAAGVGLWIARRGQEVGRGMCRGMRRLVRRSVRCGRRVCRIEAMH